MNVTETLKSTSQSVALCGDGILTEVSRDGQALILCLVSWQIGDVWVRRHTLKGSGCEETQGRGGHVQAQDRGLEGSFPLSPQHGPALPTRWLGTSGRQNCETSNCCRGSPPGHHTSPRQPQDMNARLYNVLALQLTYFAHAFVAGPTETTPGPLRLTRTRNGYLCGRRL